ncbi:MULTISPECIES: extracellular solute-binding protein [unclassified Paenibacillus]|uniref:extracellular solute-binding protein n=1 Tax=unclassified Paenibacillus TaxID=185978 RepID=UPI002789271B|nr:MULTISPECIES: extracellular solute-binding protein [unclassified Paenibacillus]MDQ0902303.1 putative aldouronate transport system substrate-binding protein [Paenibacillus sp. V4I7]MDQ0919199.1 putative aldouronate transport system substrate-binding protein [Paenibacillus sp. V4I5]
MKRYSVFIVSLLISSMLLTACSQSKKQEVENTAKISSLSLVVSQIGEIPPKNNEMEKAIEAYTNTDLQIQWIPFSAYDEKVKVMIASGELPKLIKLSYTPTIIATLKAGQFWEIGPYLKDYQQLSAQNMLYYDNIAVGGKIYGVPLYRPLGRAVIHYRKDWFDILGLKLPKTLDDWYTVIKALTLGDPDKNGKNDTYGMILEKRYNQDVSSILTRFSVSQGGPNKWKVENGRFTPEFMTEPFHETMKLFKRLYQEKLMNQDFAVADATETSKLYELGRAGTQVVGGNAQSWQDKLVKAVPSAVVEVAPLEGPEGIRLPGEPGNVGFLAIPKDAVKTEAEMRKILAFLDKLLEPAMQTVLSKGIENRHWIDKGEYTEVLDRELDLKEVKTYRDTFPYIDSNPALKPIRQPDLYRKNQQIIKENELYIVPNPALTLESETYAERGKELEVLITDAQTKFIMGKIDEAGWKSEIEKWREAGGDKMIREYEEAYTKKDKDK